MIRSVTQTGSTNDDVFGLARSGAAEGVWLRADMQTGGRGRSGRTWVSPPGNFYASTLVRLVQGDPAAPGLAFVAAVALDDAVSKTVPSAQTMIKWPNDLLVDGAKVAGILLEREGDMVVSGFGVNLAHHPEELDRPVTSLAKLGVALPGPETFLHELARAFSHWLAIWRREGFAPVRARWIARAHLIGTPLAADIGDGQRTEGLFDGLDEMGALRLRLANGTHRVIQAGDIFLI